jgi:hypothetical protein
MQVSLQAPAESALVDLSNLPLSLVQHPGTHIVVPPVIPASGYGTSVQKGVDQSPLAGSNTLRRLCNVRHVVKR